MKFKTEPFPYQLRIFEEQKDRNFYAYLWDRGLGKSKAVLDSISYLYKVGKIDRVVIIGPKSAYFDWEIKHIPEHMSVEEDQLHIHEWQGATSKKEQKAIQSLCRYDQSKLKIFVVNSEAFQYPKIEKYMKQFLNNRTYVIIDESHFFKNLSSKRTRNVLSMFKNVPYKRIATGTVMEKPEDLYSQFQFLKFGCLGFTKFTAFKQRYCVLKRMRFGNGPAFDQVVGYRNLNELKEKIESMGSILYKEDVHDLPPKIYQTVNVKLTPQQKKHYDKMQSDFFTYINGDEVETNTAITMAMKLHQITCGVIHAEEDNHIIEGPNPKIQAIKDILTEGKKSIVFCNLSSNFALEHVYNELSKDFKCAKFYGPTSLEERKQIIHDFQKGDLQVFIANQTAAEGITLTEAHNVIYYSNSYRIIKRDQSEDRAHRVGVKHAVNIVDIIAINTIDETIVNALKNKEDIRDRLLKDRSKKCQMRDTLLTS